ncbi:hypothetical protein [Anaeromicrobium sediminis]|uniref:DUF2569 domain-containing protein n=1 Tax=Anaeromicrobium sediminis TaxID=1478221 RepID=A0A267MNG8_9FIRM|nr:hypothetical protein [Anaeromicrobium sediminis]PAB60425.1 hypothetical protein CCE28_05890 [Anaeromicrobium sediminis]
MSKERLSRGIKTIVWVNSIAAVITSIFWILVMFKIFIQQNNDIAMDMASKASTLGFLISDLVLAVPILIISIPGLLKLRSWGWTFGQMANILWIYSLTSLWARDIYTGVLTPGDIIFLPFAFFSIWSINYLWRNRRRFNIS